MYGQKCILILLMLFSYCIQFIVHWFSGPGSKDSLSSLGQPLVTTNPNQPNSADRSILSVKEVGGGGRTDCFHGFPNFLLPISPNSGAENLRTLTSGLNLIQPQFPNFNDGEQFSNSAHTTNSLPPPDHFKVGDQNYTRQLIG